MGGFLPLDPEGLDPDGGKVSPHLSTEQSHLRQRVNPLVTGAGTWAPVVMKTPYRLEAFVCGGGLGVGSSPCSEQEAACQIAPPGGSLSSG